MCLGLAPIVEVVTLSRGRQDGRRDRWWEVVCIVVSLLEEIHTKSRPSWRRGDSSQIGRCRPAFAAGGCGHGL